MLLESPGLAHTGNAARDVPLRFREFEERGTRQLQAIAYLVRHGTVDNPRKIVYGSLPGFALSARGRHEARRVGRAIAKRPTTVSLIATSPLLRAVQTAVEISRHCGGPSVLTMPGLGEWMLTDRWAGRTWGWIKRHRPEEWSAYIGHPLSVTFAGESLEEVARRMLVSIEEAWRESLRRASFWSERAAPGLPSQNVPEDCGVAEGSRDRIERIEKESESRRAALGLASQPASVAFCVVSHADPLKAALLTLTGGDLDSLHSIDLPVGSCFEVLLSRRDKGEIRAEGVKRLT